MTANDKYSLLNRDNLLQHFQVQLSQKQRNNPHHMHWSLWTQFNWKKCLLVICKIRGTFVNTLTAYEKYSVLNWDNFLQHFQIQLSQKQEFSSIFFPYWKSRSNLENFQKKYYHHSWCIFQLTDCEKRGKINVPFQRTFWQVT